MHLVCFTVLMRLPFYSRMNMAAALKSFLFFSSLRFNHSKCVLKFTISIGAREFRRQKGCSRFIFPYHIMKQGHSRWGKVILLIIL